MMNYSRSVCRMLHDEHIATLGLLDRVESLLAKHRKSPPDAGDPGLGRLMSELQAAVEGEIGRHFAFEEEQLFPRIAELGDADICEVLADEHAAMLPLGQELVTMAAGGDFTPENWSTFRNTGAELCRRMIEHIQKEEMALLPMLEELLDDDRDMELSTLYAQA
jgi:DUF438 domain-containing protein